MALTKMNTDLNIIAALDDEPNSVGGLSATELKAKFDESGNAIKTYINETLTAETDAHIDNTDNPHTVTAAQVGLGNCDNTADIDKPVSTPQQEALNLKANSDNVLEKNNIAEYNPTANYHPATKKYVDDTVGQAVLGSIPDGTITEVKLDASLSEKINSAAPELHASQHAKSGADPITPASIGAVASTQGTATLPAAASWISNSAAGQRAYYVDIAIAPLTADNDIFIDRAYTVDKASDDAYAAAFSCVSTWVQSAGTLRAYAETPPESACPMNWTVIDG